VACPFGRLVLTTCPHLSTPILSDPSGWTLNVPLGRCTLMSHKDDLLWGAGIPAANSLYQGEAPEPLMTIRVPTKPRRARWTRSHQAASMPSLSSFAKGVPGSSLEHPAGTGNWRPAYPAFESLCQGDTSPRAIGAKLTRKRHVAASMPSMNSFAKGVPRLFPTSPLRHSQYMYADYNSAGWVVTQVCS
jgi:hypothetical protein